MSGFLMHVGASVQCTHAGQATIAPAQSRVLVGGQPVATMSAQITVAGCTFVVGNKPQPCVTIRWLMPSARVLVTGQPAMLVASPGPGAPGLCQSAEQIPQGPPTVGAVQSRAIAM